ncbi:MAG: hypothetical protein K6F10_04470 [Paludibacteraceae bacterium]|nr:hypothetical protein [Paludibacteraceae bacterium]
MPKTIVIRDSSISELVLGDKHIHNYTAEKGEQPPKPEREAEDVPFEEVDTHFSHITELCRQKNMVDHVENTLRAACCGSAEELWKRIHEFEFMGYLDTAGMSSEQLYRDICAFWGQLKYTSRNFNKYRFSSK